MAPKKEKLTKMPTESKLQKLKLEDAGHQTASTDAVPFLESRRQAVFKIARHYHLDQEELFQEGYEILLTCLRDFKPVYQKANGDIVSVMFTTFFGSRMEGCAMEMRNGNPEYKARQAFTEKLGADEKARFRSDPPLLVQHLDHESPMQEMLAGEASAASYDGKKEIALKIMRDSFFEKVLNELVAKETDEKKKAALLYVKVGGVYNFQEIAYHFGVTDSRASQVMNELMDAFYVQRMIDGDAVSVSRDFARLKFNEKRINRLILRAMNNATDGISLQLVDVFSDTYPTVKTNYLSLKEQIKNKVIKEISTSKEETHKEKSPVYQDVFTSNEIGKYPLQSVELRPISSLRFIEEFDFHSPESGERFDIFSTSHEFDDGQYPALITEEGVVIDGERRIKLAQEEGRADYMCVVHRIPTEMDCKLMRVMVNMRTQKPTKIDLYYAISVLADIGLSQQKIADCVGTSRTNVLVYAKVKDKAGATLRALFEDGLIQVTNASSCSDLSEDIQGKISSFIRKFGMSWSKGAKFNDLHQAALEGTIDNFIAKYTNSSGVQLAPVSSEGGGAVVSSRVVQSLQKRIEIFERDITDAEVWSQRRETVISTQKEDLNNAHSEIDALKKEIEATELMRFGSPKIIEDVLKELKAFYAVNERIVGASHALIQATKGLRKMKLSRKHALEIQNLVEEMDKNLNILRLEVVNQVPKNDILRANTKITKS